MKDRARWDAKYAAGYGDRVLEPDAHFVEALARLGADEVVPGRALDLACGTGRHALHLAELGWDTHGWDVSPVGLELLAERARERNVSVRTRAVDAVSAAFAPEELGAPFDLVVCVSFLDRPLFARLSELVTPGGRLVFATFTLDYPGERPPRAFRLEPGELATGVPGFETLWHAEDGGRAGVLARRVPSVRT